MAKAIDAQTHISSLAQRYQQFGVDADRAVCQWRLSRNLFYDLTASASTVDNLSLNYMRQNSYGLQRFTFVVQNCNDSASDYSLCWARILEAVVHKEQTEIHHASRTVGIIYVSICWEQQLSVDDLVAKFASVADRRMELA